MQWWHLRQVRLPVQSRNGSFGFFQLIETLCHRSKLGGQCLNLGAESLDFGIICRTCCPALVPG